MTEQVVIRPYQEGDEVAINEGFNRTFGLERSLAEWQWKYPAAPEGRWIMLAVDPAGRVLAHYGAVPSSFRCGDTVVRAGQITDAYAVPEVQGKRVFSQCYETFIERFGNPDDLPLMYGFPGTRHYEMGIKVLKYVPLGPVPYWRRGVERRWAPWRPLVRLRRGFDRAAVDALWQRAAGRYPWGNVRDGAWLERRLTGRPGVDYQHLSVWRGGQCEGWAVTRVMERRLAWVELVWDGARRSSLETLAEAVVKGARRQRCASVDLWLGGDEEALEVLRALGWCRTEQPDGLRMVARAFRPEVDLERIRRELYLTAADSDVV